MVLEMLLLYLAHMFFISCLRASKLLESFLQLSREKEPEVKRVEDEEEEDEGEGETLVVRWTRGLVFNILWFILVM